MPNFSRLTLRLVVNGNNRLNIVNLFSFGGSRASDSCSFSLQGY